MITALLTDDEVVAVAVHGGVAWPHPLPTVPMDSSSLFDSAAKGTRSLVVRGLARSNKDGLVLDEHLASIAKMADASTFRVIAYIASASEPATLAGSSIYLYLPEDENDSGLLDLVSANGIHDLREASREDAANVILAAMENVFSCGVAAEGEAVGEPAFFATSSMGNEVVRVTSGAVAFGQLDTEDDQGSFELAREVMVWDTTAVATALGLGVEVSS